MSNVNGQWTTQKHIHRMIIANGKCTREHNESLPLTTKMHLSLMIKMNNELNIKAKATIYY